MFNLTRGEELTALIAAGLVGLAVAVVCFSRGDRPRTLVVPLNKSRDIAVQRKGAKTRDRIWVHISGEVQRNGLLELRAGSRMQDAVDLAGTTENADLDALNLAAPLLDGERIVVPSKSSSARRAAVSPWVTSAIKVNINEANRQELESLPGIGPTLAGRIIEFRNAKKFEKVDDLLEVRGIGPATLEKIRNLVSVK